MPKSRREPPKVADRQRLAEILADMVRSALAWEEEHGEPASKDELHNNQKSPSNALTGIPHRIHCPPHGGPPLKLIKGGKDDGDTGA